MTEEMDYTGFSFDDFAADKLDAAADTFEERGADEEFWADFFKGDTDEDESTDIYGNIQEWCECERDFIDEDLGICEQCYRE